MKKISLKNYKASYKWVVVFICVMMLFFGLGFCSSAKSMYIVPITTAFGFSRSAYTIDTTCRYATIAFVSLFFNRLVTRFGTKKLISAGIVCYIIYAILNALASSLFAFYLSGVFLGLGVAWSATTMVSLVINKWFTKNKGTILGAILSSNAIGSAVAVSVLTPIIYEDGNPFGYRKAYFITAAVLLVVLILVLILYKEPSSPDIDEIDTKKTDATKEQPRKADCDYDILLGSIPFYAIIACLLLHALISVGNVVAPHFTDIGFDPSFVALNLSTVAIGLAVCKFLVGIIYDRLGIKIAINMCLLSSCISNALLLIISANPTGKILAISHSILLAVACPIETVMIPILALDLFGERSLAKALAVTSAAFTVGQAVNSPISNLFYDFSGNYKLFFLVSTISSVAIFVLINISISVLNKKKKQLAISLHRE